MIWTVRRISYIRTVFTMYLCIVARRVVAGRGIPDGVAVLAGLAVQETQLLERFAEDVFSAHFERVCCVFRTRGRFAVVVDNQKRKRISQ